MASYWLYLAGAATFIFVFIFIFVITVCCMFKQKKEPYYANTGNQQVKDSRTDETIYENDHELKKKISERKIQFSSVYINRPENKVAIYANTTANTEDSYHSGAEHDYENVEVCDR